MIKQEDIHQSDFLTGDCNLAYNQKIVSEHLLKKLLYFYLYLLCSCIVLNSVLSDNILLSQSHRHSKILWGRNTLWGETSKH